MPTTPASYRKAGLPVPKKPPPAKPKKPTRPKKPAPDKPKKKPPGRLFDRDGRSLGQRLKEFAKGSDNFSRMGDLNKPKRKKSGPK
jgi:hypothetical protein